ncbi:hypothetical protein F4802DRAFT_609474 [Xylaria palmicola]|nr:hypothetical protein F4802DRAFT_609474 [Xylaria palmicola]
MSSENYASTNAPSAKSIGDILGEAFAREEFQADLKKACQGKSPEQVLQEATMAVPMLLALTICPALLGTQEAIRQSQSKNKREEHRARRCNLVVSCVKQSIRSRDINGKLVVLKDNKLWITTASPVSHEEESENLDDGYPFSGYFLPYPDATYEGLVSTISDDPPMLNWIYVDRNTYEVKYGLRTDAQEHITGPFDCTRQDRRMTLEGWEGFVAVEDYPGTWSLYFDHDDDGLATKVPMGTRVLEVELTRREKKERKPEPDPNGAQTLDEMMKQHKERSAKEDEERNGFLHDAEQSLHHGQPQSPGHEPTDSATEPGIADLEITSTGMENLKLDDDEAMDTHGQSGHATPTAASSSADSDNFSLWSAPKKINGFNDNASVAGASSITTDYSADVSSQDFLEPHYRKPYVEDVLGDDSGDIFAVD